VSVPAGPATWARPASAPPHAPADGRLHLVVQAQRDLACSPRDPEQVFDLLATAVLSIFDAEGAVAAEPQGDQVVARASLGTSGPPVGAVIPVHGTLSGVALRTLEPQLCRDADSDPRTSTDISRRHRTRSSIIVPLVQDGVAIGLVAALSSTPFAFDESDLDLLSLLADVAAGSLDAALRKSRQQTLEARSASIVEVLAEGLVEISDEGRAVFANRSAQRMLGFTWDPGSGILSPAGRSCMRTAPPGRWQSCRRASP